MTTPKHLLIVFALTAGSLGTSACDKSDAGNGGEEASENDDAEVAEDAAPAVPAEPFSTKEMEDGQTYTRKLEFVLAQKLAARDDLPERITLHFNDADGRRVNFDPADGLDTDSLAKGKVYDVSFKFESMKTLTADKVTPAS